MAIKQENLIYKAWIGYVPDGENAEKVLRNIRFVVIVNEKPYIEFPTSFKGIKIYCRQKDEVSNEMGDVASSELRYEPLGGINGQRAEELFNQHSNLNIIFPSSVKSRKFSTTDPERIEKRCIVLCCHIKGIIPLGEKTFPKTIESLSTDVREGFWSFCNDIDMKLGSGITCLDARGTVGPYVNSKNGLGFLTAAHVVANNEILNADTISKKRAFTSKKMQIKDLSDRMIGTVVDGCFSFDDTRETSIDAALVELENNVRPRVCFTQKMDHVYESGFTEISIPKVESWKILTKDETDKKKKSQVIKIGGNTGLTSGYLYCYGANVRKSDKQHDVGDHLFPFYNQMIVRPQSGSTRAFCKPGDSGACCFLLVDEPMNLIRPFGLLIGQVNRNFGLVTPLEDIFKHLQLDINKDVYLPSEQNRATTFHFGLTQAKSFLCTIL